MTHRPAYIPALGLRILTPLYDPLLRIFFREDDLKQQFLMEADIVPGQHVLDLGCGTGTLMAMIKKSQPSAIVIGLDGDADVLAIAAAKTDHTRLQVFFSRALASALPYPTGTFDRVLSSLVFHHLSSSTKRAVLREVYRVLRADGELHILDFGPPHTPLAKLAMPLVRHLEEVADNIDGLLPAMACEAGFFDVMVVHEESVLAVTTVTHLRARKQSVV